MEIFSEKKHPFMVIHVKGDVDAGSSIKLDTAIAEAANTGETKIIINCKELNYISSAGLGVFMSYLQDFEHKSILFVLCHLSEKVFNVFRVLGLDELIQIVPTEEDAKNLIV